MQVPACVWGQIEVVLLLPSCLVVDITRLFLFCHGPWPRMWAVYRGSEMRSTLSLIHGWSTVYRCRLGCCSRIGRLVSVIPTLDYNNPEHEFLPKPLSIWTLKIELKLTTQKIVLYSTTSHSSGAIDVLTSVIEHKFVPWVKVGGNIELQCRDNVRQRQHALFDQYTV